MNLSPVTFDHTFRFWLILLTAYLRRFHLKKQRKFILMLINRTCKILKVLWNYYNDNYIYLCNQRTVSGIFKIKEIPLYNRWQPYKKIKNEF